MDYSFRVYQVEIASGDLSVVSGSVRSHEEDMIVQELGSIERSIEHENNRYKLDSTNLVVSGLPEHYFKDYTRPSDPTDAYKPFVAEIRDGPQDTWSSNSVVFHGIIDPSSIRFSQRSERTNFKVWSWDRIIGEAGEVPARSVIEADVVDGASGISEGSVDIDIAKTENVRPGDLAVFSATEQRPEVRRAIQSVSQNSNSTTIEIGFPANSGSVVKPGGISPKFINFKEGSSQFTPFEIAKEDAFTKDGTQLVEFYNESGNRENVPMKVTGANGNSVKLEVELFNVTAPEEAKGNVLAEPDEKGDLAEIYGLDLSDPSQVSLRFYKKRVFSGAGEKAEIYGRAAYGYDPTNGGLNVGLGGTAQVDYEIADANEGGLIPAIFSLDVTPELDLLSAAVNSFDISVDGKIDMRQAFPDKLEDSLRAISRTGRAYVQLVPTADTNGVPRLTVSITERSNAVSQTAQSLSGAVVKEWNENVLPEPLRGVKVTTQDTGKPQDYGDLVGWYPRQEVGSAEIIETSGSAQSIRVSDYDPELAIGDTVTVENSDRLDGTYTVDGTVDIPGTAEMNVLVKESVPTLDTLEANGQLRWRELGSGAPDDSNVIEIDTVAWPAFSGSRVGETVQDKYLSTIAEQYFDFFTALGGKGKATLSGLYPDIVNERFTFDVPLYEKEDGTTEPRTVLVTKAEANFKEKTTQIEFRRGDFTPATETYLVPRANVVDEAYIRSSADSTVEVRFDGSDTTAPMGASYTWEIDIGSTGVADTTANKGLVKEDLPTGVHTWKLSVSANGNTRTQTGSVTVEKRVPALVSKPDLTFNSFEGTDANGNRQAKLDVVIGNDGTAPSEIRFYSTDSGGLGSLSDETPTETVTSPSTGTTVTHTTALAEGHTVQIRAVVAFANQSNVRSIPYNYDADTIPDAQYSWRWEWQSASETYNLYLTWNGDEDTESIEVTSADIAGGVGEGRTGTITIGSGLLDTAAPDFTATAYSGPSATGTPQADPPTFSANAPLVDPVELGDLKEDVSLNTEDIIAVAEEVTQLSSETEANFNANVTEIAANKDNISQNVDDILANADDIIANADSISTLEAQVGSGAIDAGSSLTVAANSNTTDIGSNATSISELESFVGIGETLNAKSNLTLLANANEADTNENATAIADLEAQVGTGSLDAGSSLTLAANTNTGDISTNATDISNNSGLIGTNADNISANATSISELESFVGIGETLNAKSNLTLLANANENDTNTNATAIADLEAKVNDDTQDLTAFSNLTLAAQKTGDNASAITTLESKVDSGGDDTLDQSAASLTLAANQNRADIELIAERLTQEREARSGLELTASETAAQARLNAEVIGDPSRIAKSTLTLQAKQNADDIDGNDTAIADLEAQVGSGTIDADSSLTLAANKNTGDIDTNATTIADLNTFVGINESLNAETNLTLLANANESQASTNATSIANLKAKVNNDNQNLNAFSDLTLAAEQTGDNASAITTLESKVDRGGQDTLNQSAGSLTIAANENRADIELIAERLVQETESRAGLEITASETAAEVTLAAKYNENQAALTTRADADGSEITLDATQIIVNGTITEAEVGTLILDGTGEITNANRDFIIDDNGLELDASSGAAPAKIQWESDSDNDGTKETQGELLATQSRLNISAFNSNNLNLTTDGGGEIDIKTIDGGNININADSKNNNSGQIILKDIPTSDPGVAGALYLDTTDSTIKRS